MATKPWKPSPAAKALLRKRLDTIDRWLAKGDVDARLLYAVLTALRGPDDPELNNDKRFSTGVIRARAFPKAHLDPHYTLGISVDAPAVWITKTMLLAKHRHFLVHVSGAAQALGLPTPISRKKAKVT